MDSLSKTADISLKDVLIFFFVLAVSAVLTKVGQINNDFLYFTAKIAGLEAGILPLFQIFSHWFLTLLMSLIYLFLYPLLLIGTYFYLKKHGDHVKYVKSYVLLLLITAPLFYFVPVKVSGFYLNDVEAILYNQSIIALKFFSSIGDYYSAFPSLHTGLSALAAMYLQRTNTKAGKFGYFATFLIIVSTLYLGIHWLADIAAGLTLAYLSFAFFQKSSVLGRKPIYLSTIQKYLMKIIGHGR